MKKAVIFIAVIIIQFLLSSSATAAAPLFIPLQGVLEDSEGEPMDGSVDIHFAIYDSEVEGARLWYETQNVLVESGLFIVYLGEVESLDMTMFRDNTNLWLGVQVEDDPEMERVYFGSTPYAGFAQYCGHVTEVVEESVLPAGVVLGEQSCTAGDMVVGVDMSGILVCATDEDTTYLAGDGLLLTSGAFSVDPTAIQARVWDACPPRSAINSIQLDGTVACESDADTLDGLDAAAFSPAGHTHDHSALTGVSEDDHHAPYTDSDVTAYFAGRTRRMPFSRGSGTVITFNAPDGTTATLDLGDGSIAVQNEYIAYTPGDISTDSILYFNIEAAASGACTLLHSEDDTPRTGYYFATDGGNCCGTIWGNETTSTFIFRREGQGGRDVIPRYAGFQIFCP